jgi:hypothetical protein
MRSLKGKLSAGHDKLIVKQCIKKKQKAAGSFM